MPEPSTLGIFAIATIGLLVIPGPAVTYIVTRSIDQGRAAGLVSVLGIHVGTLVHIVAATVGLSAILASSAAAYATVKYLGAAYLVFLGVRTVLRTREDEDGQGSIRPASLSRIFRQGVVVNVLNPKTALFFLAFLPQFVEPSRGPAALQTLVLGLTFIVLGLISDGTYAMLSARLGSWLKSRPRFARNRRLFTGGVLVTLGVAAAVSGRRDV
jgi:threonine/homoserine/homoserine lactone efflux protein